MTAAPRPTAVWDDVAADGTDPAVLAALVTCLAVDPTGLRQRLRAADAHERGIGGALRDALAEVPADPGDAAGRAAAAWAAAGVTAAVAGDPGYPGRLRAADDPQAPLLVARRGAPLPPADRAGVAIVGARRASSYGRGVAALLAEAASDAGVRVVSGGAVGIDAAAHGAALSGPGGTTVVLGCGHAVAYPRPHAAPGRLFERVLAAGGTILSTYLPHDPPRAPRVRDRNRVVAGLADAVVVVEGGARSGALVTASAAADLGVTVLAVPGDIRASGSAAPHRLLAEGAGLCTGAADLLDAVGQAVPVATAASTAGTIGAGAPERPGTAIPGLPEAAIAVLSDRWPRAIDVDELSRASDIDTATLLAALTRARVAGTVAMGRDGVRLRRDPARTRFTN